MSMIGGVLGAGISSAGQLYANSQNIQYANAMFQDQVELANTAHQREVRDLRAAGLNPILSAQGSNGAETPSANNVNQENPLNAAAQLVSMDATAKQAEAARINAETNAWQVYDAKQQGYAGFNVMGFGSDAKVQMVNTVRVNKVTGECYTLDGRPVRIIGAKEPNTANTPDGEVTVHMDGFDVDDSKSVNDQLKRQRKVTNPRDGLHFPGVY